MDLREAGIREAGAAFVGPPDGRGVGAPRVRRKVEDVAVPAGGEHHGIRGLAADFTGHEIPDDDALRLPVHEHEIEHLGVRMQFHLAGPNHLGQRRIGAQQQLLPGLATSVKGAGNLGAAKGAIGEQTAVFTGKGHALRDALVDDVDGDLRQPVHVGLAGAIVAALDRVVEQAVHAVAVVLVVLGGGDSALGRDRVRAPGAVMEDKTLHLIPQLGERGGSGRAGETSSDHDDLVLPLVGRIDQLDVRLVFPPLVGEGAGGNLRVELGHGGKD